MYLRLFREGFSNEISKNLLLKSWNTFIRGRANDPALSSMMQFHPSPTLVLSVGVERRVHQGYKLRTLPVPIMVNQQAVAASAATACSPFDCCAHLSASAVRFHFGMYWFSGKLLACRGKNAFLLPKMHRADDTFSFEPQQVFRPDSATPLLVQSHYLTAWCRTVFSFRPITVIILSVGSFGNSKSHWAATKISSYLNWIIKPKLAHADFMEAPLLYIFLGAAIWSESKLALIDLIDCINVSPLPRGSINFPQKGAERLISPNYLAGSLGPDDIWHSEGFLRQSSKRMNCQNVTYSANKRRHWSKVKSEFSGCRLVMFRPGLHWPDRIQNSLYHCFLTTVCL